MRTPDPYEVPEKTKEKAKGIRKSSRRQVVSDSSSDDSKVDSSPEEEEKEASSSAGGEKKRKASPTRRPKGPRKDGPFLRTAPPTPTTAMRGGPQGPSPWQDRKCPNS